MRKLIEKTYGLFEKTYGLFFINSVSFLRGQQKKKTTSDDVYHPTSDDVYHPVKQLATKMRDEFLLCKTAILREIAQIPQICVKFCVKLWKAE